MSNGVREGAGAWVPLDAAASGFGTTGDMPELDSNADCESAALLVTADPELLASVASSTDPGPPARVLRSMRPEPPSFWGVAEASRAIAAGAPAGFDPSLDLEACIAVSVSSLNRTEFALRSSDMPEPEEDACWAGAGV